MKIRFQKCNAAEHLLSTFLDGKLQEQHVYNTKTYFLHDIVHYCVETELGIKSGFWGLLAQGYKTTDFGRGKVSLKVLGKTEKIVGPVQSFFSGHMPEELFWENMKLISFEPPVDFLNKVVKQIKAIEEQWRYMAIGEVLELEFRVK
jgi:hypothetical protein